MNNANAASTVVLAGAIIFSAGVIAEAMKGYAATAAFVLGTLLVLVGGVVFAAGVLKPFWDAIPVDGKKREGKKTDGGEA
jgi:hypothetical protein